MVHSEGKTARTSFTPSRARIFAMARAAAPGDVFGAMVKEATPFLNEAGREEREEAGARTPRIFARRMDSSKSDGAATGAGFFLETRSESGLSGTTSNEVESFSETTARFDGREFGGTAEDRAGEGCSITRAGLGSTGVIGTGSAEAMEGGRGENGLEGIRSWRAAHPVRTRLNRHATTNNHAGRDPPEGRLDSGVRAGNRLSNIRLGAGIESPGVDARPRRRGVRRITICSAGASCGGFPSCACGVCVLRFSTFSSF